MKITLTIINQATNHRFDIQMDNRQKISTTLDVLNENMPGFLLNQDHESSIWSERNRSIVDQMMTYEEASIFSGDKLILSVKE